MNDPTIDKRLERGVALQKSGKLLEAAKIYSAVLQADRSNAGALHLLGTIEIERRNFENALALVSKALRLSPRSAAIHHDLAYIHGALGRTDRAEAHYRKAIALKPDYAEAYFNLAGSVKFVPGDPVIGALEGLLAKPDLARGDRVFLNFAAGKLFDDLGDYDRAFEHYRKGNAARRAEPNPAYASASIDAIIAVFTADLLRRRAAEGSPSDLPIFVVGVPRSGTTLVEQILASHPQVHGAGELSDIDAIAKAFPEHAPDHADYPACMATVGTAPLRGLADAYLRRLAEEAPGAGRIVDKAPLNFRHLGMIALMFPKARIVHCRRDPLDTCVSCYFQNFARGQEYSFDLRELGRFYRDYRRLMAHWAQVLPTAVLEVPYEALVADREQVSRALLAFCGLDWDPACADFHRTVRPVGTASRWQVRQPIYRSSVARWRRYEKQLQPLIEALGPFADESLARTKG